MIEEKLLTGLQHALKLLEIDENYEVCGMMHNHIQVTQKKLDIANKPVRIDLTKLVL
ncbi:hypothetical protein OQZ33_06955 [Pedobacter sp. MC2016-05]|uniref:hypothetical protein n=1 Tax=Pedobacter sp. MC2016-05 TaxID=2994474 RepID=UPI0022483622|nr:hypothetical protein [Pedobacter sp. MC2016-05]MCX2474063.1 hypothetical protein [Pedobacter sp. MC2016-05]